jgi:valyl-tRNA synthetase
MNLGEEPLQPGLPEELTTPDRWVLSKYNRLVGEATENIEKYELGIAVSKLYDFVWDVFCDWYIELAKPRLLEGGEAADATRRVLVYVLSNTLAMLHPFMPFITEEIWQTLPHEGESVMVSSWPKQESNWDYTAEEQRFETVMAAIKAIRMARANANVPPSKKATVYIKSAQPKVFSDSASFIERLAFASSVVNVKEDFVIEGAMHIVTDEARMLIPMNELVNFEVEKARLDKEQKSCEKEIDLVQGRLNNQDFVSKAPQKVIEGERDKLAKALERLEKIKESLFALGE